jgi:hypothetical protein
MPNNAFDLAQFLTGQQAATMQRLSPTAWHYTEARNIAAIFSHVH